MSFDVHWTPRIRDGKRENKIVCLPWSVHMIKNCLPLINYSNWANNIRIYVYRQLVCAMSDRLPALVHVQARVQSNRFAEQLNEHLQRSPKSKKSSNNNKWRMIEREKKRANSYSLSIALYIASLCATRCISNTIITILYVYIHKWMLSMHTNPKHTMYTTNTHHIYSAMYSKRQKINTHKCSFSQHANT